MGWESCFRCCAGKAMSVKVNRRVKLLILVSVLNLIGLVFIQSTGGFPYQIRFSYPPLNYWFVAAMVLSIPILLFLIARQLQEGWLRGLVVVTGVLFSIPCLMFSGCTALEAPNLNEKIDESYVLISQASRGVSNFRLYRTNCGATCAYALDLRQELDLFLGLKLVSPIWSVDRTSEGHVVVDKSTVKVLSGTDVLVVLQK